MKTRCLVMPRLVLALTLCLAANAAAARATQQTCVDVQVGTAQSYDCLNQILADVARHVQRFSADTSAPYNATSSGNVTGQFNESATRNRLGANFGRSVTAQRPATNYGGALPTPH